MKIVVKKISFFCLIITATLFVRSASAATMTILPESSHYQGRSYFRTLTADGILSGRVEYAVYDSQGGNEFSLTGGTGRYTYAYQVFNDGDDTVSALEYFAVLGIGESAIYDLTTDISAVDDDSGGIDSTAMYFGAHDATTGPENAVWEFEGGILQTNAHSFFLVISSDYDYATGTYQVIKTTSPITPIPNPEPSTIALLSIGGMMTLLKRRRRI
ncbi:MAG: PEP-CTERM sorting domain-containing protein [Planctomycetota bacterium]